MGVGEIVEQRPGEQLAGAITSGLEDADGVAPGLGRADRAGQADLGDVVDDSTQLPDTTERFVLCEIGLPDAVAPRGHPTERRLALARQLPALAGCARRLQQRAGLQRAPDRRLAGVKAVGL